MQFAAWPSYERPWDEVLTLARWAESVGFGGFWAADHFLQFGAADDDRGDGEVQECWTVLTAVGAAVPRLRLVSMVSPVTFHHPVVLTKRAVTADHVSGGRVVLAGDALVADPYALWRTVIQRSVTRMMSAPSAFYPLADVACRMGDAGAMRTIMVGGEALLPTRLLEFTRAFGDRLELLNIWGTTETTIWTTSAQLDTTDPRNIIGTPIDGSRVLVLDPWLRPVPVGVWGEIYQDGPQVSLGYRGRPELSATAFVADPFEAPSSTGKKMYRTGDIGRWTRDGLLESLSRRDS